MLKQLKIIALDFSPSSLPCVSLHILGAGGVRHSLISIPRLVND